jgi:S-(hydroxymethyl)glutathione dehydrogenase/alcohol dehydrogenase
MKAAYIEKLATPLKVDGDIEIPDLQSGQVLVDIAYSGVCRSQLMEAKGLRGEDPYVPHMLGHEGTGIVRAVGEGVTKIKIGEKVVLGWIKGDGNDGACPQYRCGDKKINAGRVTTFMESAIVSESRLVSLPAGIPMKLGILFGCALPTGAGIVMNSIKPEKDSTILIWGLGGIGLSALIATHFFDCSQVIAVDVSDEKLELAKTFGATTCLNLNRDDIPQRVRELTGGKGVDYAVEAAGFAKTIEQCFMMVRDGGGKCYFASHPKEGDLVSIDPYEMIKGKQLFGSWGGDSVPDRDIPKYAELYLVKKLPLEKLLSKTYKLDEVNEALNDLDQGRIARAVLEINPELEHENG